MSLRLLRRALTAAVVPALMAPPLVAVAEDSPEEGSGPRQLAAGSVEPSRPSSVDESFAQVAPAEVQQGVDEGAAWLTAAVDAGTLVTEDLAMTVVALAAAGPDHAAALDRAADQLAGRPAQVTADPMTLAVTAIAADASGRDPRAFGGSDVVAALEAEVADGVCGDGWHLITGLCLIGLARTGATVPQTLVDAVAADADPTTAGILAGDTVELWATAVTPMAMASVDSMADARATGLGARDYLVLSRGEGAVLGEDLPIGLNAIAAQSLLMAGVDADHPARQDAMMGWFLEQQLADGGLPLDPGGQVADAWSTALTVITLSGHYLSADATWETGYWSHSVVGRVSGADRYEVAANVAASWTDGADTVVVVSGENFPDALSGSALAGLVGGPVLLTRKDRLPTAISDALEALTPSQIIVLGGTDSVSAAVFGELQTIAPTVDRVPGRNRYVVSADVAGYWSPGLSRVYLATGENWPDGLTGGAAAAHDGSPLLLTRHSAVPASVMDALRYLRPGEIVVLGGTTTIAGDVIDQLQAEFGDVSPYSRIRRIDGANRYVVAARVADEVSTADDPRAFLATGEKWPDALSGGALAGQLGGPVLLVRPDRVPGVTATALQQRQAAQIWAFGGPASIFPSTLSEVRLLDIGG